MYTCYIYSPSSTRVNIGTSRAQIDTFLNQAHANIVIIIKSSFELLKHSNIFIWTTRPKFFFQFEIIINVLV